MKQVLQNISNGETRLVDVPSPQSKKGHLLIKTSKSLVSVGTERMLVDFGKANWINKARQQPDKVKMVIDKVKTDGLRTTYDTVRSKLDQPLPLGYCNVGVVQDNGGTEFEVGDRVVSNGNHAEIVRIPKNLCVKVPNEVNDESAAFTVIGAIALQGIRLTKPTLGECVVVTGLGLIGLITVQLLKANGCRVLGVDFDSKKCELAKSFGAEVVDLSKGEDLISKTNAFSRGRGVDAVIITASTKSNEPVSQAAKISRKRGRIILVGVVGLELSRADFFEKELSFQVSCSYGPGRYDPVYEQKGVDYPLGYVRWTEQRNFEAVLDMMAQGKVDVSALITHRFIIDEALAAYSALDDRSALGILLDYPRSGRKLVLKTNVQLKNNISNKSKGSFAFVGAGNYASRVLIPAFKKAGAELNTLISNGGVSAVHHGEKNGFINASTSYEEALTDKSIDTIVIATQHNLHTEQIIAALKSGKNVFVEKPLALTIEDVTLIDKVYSLLSRKPVLMVGYNRRFSPLIIKMKELLRKVSEPKTFIMTMNAGSIPSDHWTQDPNVGGGRIVGEACHYVDLLRFLVGSKITSYQAMSIGDSDGVDVREDKSSISILFDDGSIGTIHYFANGGKSFPKERIEVFADDGVLQIDNFRKLIGYNWKGFKKMSLSSQDKGQKNCTEAFVSSVITGGEVPIPYSEIIEVAKVTCDIAHTLRNT